MSQEKIHNAIICGSGPAGYTAGIYLSRANLKPLLIAGPMIGGQLTTTTVIENFPGFPEGIDGNKLMIDMEQQAKNNGTEIEYEKATSIRKEEDHFVLETTAGIRRARTVIIATGASPKMLNLPSEQTFWNYGVHTCAVCDGGFYKGKNVVVVGGGDSAMEDASYLAKLCEKVYLVHRRDELRASAVMAERVLNNPKIEMVWNSTVSEVVGVVEGQHKKKVHQVKTVNRVDGTTRDLDVSAMFVAIGHIPNTDWLNGFLELEETGYLKVNAHCNTSVEGIFAGGDVHDHHYRQAITAAGFGCVAALEAERYLSRQGVQIS
ncbi:MAG: thioredoxin-disulfide reductase [Sumerlaeia bacterium]